jgi:hypothetical protein
MSLFKKDTIINNNPLNQDITTGQVSTEKVEETPQLDHLIASAKTIKKGNAYMVLGRDNPAGAASGYGGRGDTQAAAIDICVGPQGFDPQSSRFTRPNFGVFTQSGKPGDAARIYISQRADIDDYFGLCDGNVGRSTAQSAIGIKADDVRIMARRGIKIVTGHGPIQKDSMNQPVNRQFGIDLIAGNMDEKSKVIDAGPIVGSLFQKEAYLQPLIKGNNLVTCLNKMNVAIGKLNAFVTQFALLQMNLNTSLANNPQIGSSGVGVPVVTFPNPSTVAVQISTQVRTFNEVVFDLTKLRFELGRIELNHLKSSGNDWVCSRYNRTN